MPRLSAHFWLPVENSSFVINYVSYLKRFSCIRVHHRVNPVCARCHNVQISRATDSILASLATVTFTTETSETDRGIIGRRLTSPSVETWLLLATVYDIYGTTCSLWMRKTTMTSFTTKRFLYKWDLSMTAVRSATGFYPGSYTLSPLCSAVNNFARWLYYIQ